jgi:hypothetical protein
MMTGGRVGEWEDDVLRQQIKQQRSFMRCEMQTTGRRKKTVVSVVKKVCREKMSLIGSRFPLLN